VSEESATASWADFLSHFHLRPKPYSFWFYAPSCVLDDSEHKIFSGPVYYWGDIDKDGYEIFACVRELFPRAISVLMDDLTLQKYTSLIQSLPQAEPSLSNLPADLRAVYERVCREGIRIEQEKIPLDQILAIL
jgi:hypothetical protein